MASEGRRYISYLLRLWQVRVGGELVWRASLESPHTGKRQGFSSLANLVSFLEGEWRVALALKHRRTLRSAN